MSLSNYITLALFIFLVLIFLIDYLKKRKEDSLEKSVEKFVEKESETKERNGILNWILKRKKNITLSLLIISTLKFFIHYNFFRYCNYLRSEWGITWIPEKWELAQMERHYFIYDKMRYQQILDELGTRYHDFSCQNFLSIYNSLFTSELFLFIPITIIFLIVVWFFNDKIKAQ